MKDLLRSALLREPSTEFSAEDVNQAAVNYIREKCGLTETSSVREFRAVENIAFALIEEKVDEILPAKINEIVGQFAEVKSFARDAEVVFDIEKVGKKRAKLTISKGARGGIYRVARLDNKYFSLPTHVETVGVYVTLEEILLGTISLGELFNNILEGFSEIIYKEVFNALASGTAVLGYDRIQGIDGSTATKATLGLAIDSVITKVEQYGIPTIFGSYEALSGLMNPLATATAALAGGYPNNEDSMDIRKYGFVQEYKGHRVIRLPNYLVDNSNSEWFYDIHYVFVMPANAKPVKVALRGEMYIKKNEQAVGSEKWEAHKMVGVGVAMANNYAVIHVDDAA